MAARPGTSTYGSYRPQRPCSTIPLGVHLHTGHAAVSGARGGPRGRTSSRRPRWWSAHILYGRYGHIGRLSVSPIQIVWGFHHTFKYCKTFVLFQKLTGGGDSTLILGQRLCRFCDKKNRYFGLRIPFCDKILSQIPQELPAGTGFWTAAIYYTST